VTRGRIAAAVLAFGVLCFVAGALAVLLRAAGADSLTQAQTTSLAAAGLMAVAVGAASRRRP
jgi:hypothetical protein